MKKFSLIICIIILVTVSFIFYKEVSKNEENTQNTTTNMTSNDKNENVDKQTSNLVKNQIDKNTSNDIEKVENNTIEDKKDENNIAEYQNENAVGYVENSVAEEHENNIVDKYNGDDIDNQKIVKTLAPSGFMGSSLLRVTLFSNGELYLLKYDGEGYEEKNIVNKELIAVNVDSISSNGQGEDFEAIIVKGKSNMVIKNNNYGWIEFEN